MLACHSSLASEFPDPSVQANFLQRSVVQEYIRQVSTERGLDQHQVAGLFAHIASQPGILKAIARPAERRLTWREYRPIFLGAERIEQGRQFMQEHHEVLSRAEREYGVPAAIITAIIGVETFYGRLTGKHGALESLATLAFDYPPRAAFFLAELGEFLQLADHEGWNALEVRGSYAAAMGLPQFISSSYRQYAVDFDGDGRRDLFSSVADAIGSVANYLKHHGWRAGLPIATQWRAKDSISKAASLLRRSLRPAIHPQVLRDAGFAAEGQRHVSVMQLDGSKGGEIWVGYSNFYSITRYNHSQLYAMAVYQLSSELDAGSP